MTTITLSPPFFPDFPTISFEEGFNAVTHWFGRAWNYLKELKAEQRLASQTAILALDIAILATKVFESIPPILGRVSLTLLNFVGLLTIDDFAREIGKSCCDFRYACRERDFGMMALTAAKVTVTTTDLFLTITSASAAVVGLLGGAHYTAAYYSATASVGITSFTMGVFIQIADWELNRRLWNDLIQADEATRLRVASDFVALQSKENLYDDASYDTLALRIRWQMDAYTLRAYSRYREGSLDLYEQITQTIEHQQLHKSGGFALLAFGYISRAICRAYPNTVLQSCVETFNAAFYWCREVHHSIHHWNIRAQ